jgi:hypothetical protein
MAVGSLVQGVWKYGEDDPASPFSDTLNLLGASVRTELNTEKGKRSQLYVTPDAGFPVATATAAGETVVHNRLTVSAAAWDRVLVVTGTMHLTASAAATVDAYLYAGSTAIEQVRVAAAAATLYPFKLSGQYLLAAGAGLVLEARFNRPAGTGTVTPSLSSLSRLRISAHPAS